jgi:hypothetical protein
LKPFLTDFVNADSVDAMAATRAIKKLIRIVSEKRDSVRDIGVGPESDCFLLAKGGVRGMNHEWRKPMRKMLRRTPRPSQSAQEAQINISDVDGRNARP